MNLGVAKDQRLSLNPAQISGACGRLMCCLRYEHDFYVQSRKRFPKEGKIIVTARGEEKVLSIDIFRERITLKSSEGESRMISLTDLNSELASVGAGITPADSAADEENGDASFEISPELLYTTEHELPLSSELIVMEAREEEATTTGKESDTPADSTRAGDRDDSGARRRRGRRGGRRGRGGDQSEPK